MLFRVFPFRAGASPYEEGGALHVPRDRQGAGRHDNPAHYGALYGSREPESAVAERLQELRGREIADRDLRRRDGMRYALAALEERLVDLVDLDDPRELVRRDLRPSAVATRERARTQRIALAAFEDGHPGLSWWSTLEASWTNVTLFAEVAAPALTPRGQPEVLTVRHPALRAAAEALGVRLPR